VLIFTEAVGELIDVSMSFNRKHSEFHPLVVDHDTANHTLNVAVLSPIIVRIPGSDIGVTDHQVRIARSPVELDTGAYQIPTSRPAGIIFEFHGKGGSYDGWFSDWDKLYFNVQALDSGYGIVAIKNAALGYSGSQTLYATQPIQGSKTPELRRRPPEMRIHCSLVRSLPILLFSRLA
jgi:hypothetical protein